MSEALDYATLGVGLAILAFLRERIARLERPAAGR